VLIETPTDVRSKIKPAKRERGVGPGLTERPALEQILAASTELMGLSRGRQ
jgi:hypothetical protein